MITPSLPQFADRIPVHGQDRLRILILEDRQTDADLLRFQLGRMDWNVDIQHALSRDGFEELFVTFSPHIVISDYNLPDYTGMEALTFVRDRDDVLPFLICTGRVNEETAVACLKAGADDYVIKDDLGRMVSAASNALESRINYVKGKLAGEELRKSEENFRVVTQNAPNSVLRLDRQGYVQYCNREIEGRQPEEVIGQRLTELLTEKNAEQFMLELGICWAQKASRAFEMGVIQEGQISRWFHMGLGPLINKGLVEGAILVVTDITEKKIHEHELNELNDKLHQLSQHLETIRDEEKKRISREIHDQLGQELTGHKLGLFWVQKSLQDDGVTNKGAVLDKIAELIDLNTQTIQTVRRIAHELRPVVLDNIGLVPALEWHIDMFNKNHQTICHLDVDPALEETDKELSTTLYRIVQEALTNINRHAQAENAWVTLQATDTQVQLEVRDDGVGIDLEKAKQSKSLGLFGIQERLKAWNGSFNIEGEAGAGTRISIEIPAPELTTVS